MFRGYGPRVGCAGFMVTVLLTPERRAHGLERLGSYQDWASHPAAGQDLAVEAPPAPAKKESVNTLSSFPLPFPHSLFPSVLLSLVCPLLSARPPATIRVAQHFVCERVEGEER